jgi:outer membrane protein OmpA-like peptidoglycan-associated protein
VLCAASLAIGDIAKGFDLKPIYFDLYQYNIRPDAALELAKIYEVLIRNPKVKIK